MLFKLIGCLAVLFSLSALAQQINGAGSSAAAPIYRNWARVYQKATGVSMNYEPAGSSAGVKKIVAREVDFGASDVVPLDADLTKWGLTVFPVAITGIAPVFNLPKISEGQIRLTGSVLARIFLGEMFRWNAPELSELNPGVSLPDIPIQVVVRSDGSGTTYNFSDYLAKVHPKWKERYGVKSQFTWPDSFHGVKGSDAVAAAVRDTPGAIGYIDFGYVKDFKLKYMLLKNQMGEYIHPSSSSFRAALSASEWNRTGAFNTSLTDMAGKGSWPITMGTFVMVPAVTENPEATTRALKFFAWSFLNGDSLVQESSFVRLPDRIQGLAYKVIAGVRDKAGNLVGVSSISK